MSTGPGLSRVASTMLITSSDHVGADLSRWGTASSTKGLRGLSSAKSDCRSLVNADPATLLVGRRETLERSRGDERAVDRDCLMDEAALCRSRLVVVPHEPCQRSAAVTRTVEHVEQGRVIDLELRHEGFGRRGDELVEHGLVPGDVAPRRLGLDKLARPARIACHLLAACSFSMTWSGACTTTRPEES